MYWLTGGWVHLGAVAGKAVLMFAAALLALRLGERRALAQWTIIDFVAAVAIGAIVGRTAIASTQSFVTGAVALAALIAMHHVVSRLRYVPGLGRLMEHRVRVLVVDGRLLHRQLHICGITTDDLYARLRCQGVFDLATIRYVLYEAQGGLTVVPKDGRGLSPPTLVSAGLRRSAGLPETPRRE